MGKEKARVAPSATQGRQYGKRKLLQKWLERCFVPSFLRAASAAVSSCLFVWRGRREAFDMQKDESMSCKHPAPDGPPDQACKSFTIYLLPGFSSMARLNLPLRSISWPIPRCRLTWDVFVHPPSAAQGTILLPRTKVGNCLHSDLNICMPAECRLCRKGILFLL